MTGKERSGLTSAMKVTIGFIVVLVIAGAASIGMLNGLGASPDSATSPATTQKTRVPEPLSGATPAAGSEVPPPTADPEAGLPPRKAVKPLVQAPLPESASRNGGLVKGFPVDLAGPLASGSVLFTSIAVQGSVMQVDLVASTGAAPDEIRAHYRDLWGSLGLQTRDTSDGTVAYSGPHESVTLAVGSSGTANSYSIHGVFRTE